MCKTQSSHKACPQRKSQNPTRKNGESARQRAATVVLSGQETLSKNSVLHPEVSISFLNSCSSLLRKKNKNNLTWYKRYRNNFKSVETKEMSWYVLTCPLPASDFFAWDKGSEEQPPVVKKQVLHRVQVEPGAQATVARCLHPLTSCMIMDKLLANLSEISVTNL